MILVPEVETDINAVCRKVLRGQQSGKLHSIIVKAEGVGVSTDEFMKIIEERTGREARAVVPGYIQRGGTPSAKDRMLASLTATKAVQLLFNDENSQAVGICGSEIIAYDLVQALEMKREFNRDIYELAEVLS